MKPFLLAALIAAVAFSGCLGDDVDALKESRDSLQAQVDALENEVATLEAFDDDVDAFFSSFENFAEALVVLEFGSQPGSIWDNHTTYAMVPFFTNQTPTEDQYGGANAEHIGVASVHDVMHQWANDARTFNGTMFSFGYSFDDFNDVEGFFVDGAGAYWQLYVDGRSSSAGASLVEAYDGMTIKWVYTHF